jgi:hypothetical protein
MQRTVGLVVVLAGALATANPRTVLVAAGDCRDGALLSGVKDLRDALAHQLRDDLVEGDVVLDIVRPRAPRSLQDIERQVESAKALLYGGQDARGLEVIDRALADLERVAPTAGPWPLTEQALVLQALMFKNLDRQKEMLESFRRLVRVAPQFRLDPDAHPPSAIAALEGLKKELARSRKVALSVRTETGPMAAVFVDGAPLGATPLRLELLPGTYRVALVSGDAVSFPRRVELARETTLTVDLAFEAAVSLQPPLCLHGVDDGAAVKLAQLATADRVVVLRNTASRGNPPYLAGALYEVATGRQERAGAVQPELLPNLAAFLATGKEQRGVEKPGAAVLKVAGVESPRLDLPSRRQSPGTASDPGASPSPAPVDPAGRASTTSTPRNPDAAPAATIDAPSDAAEGTRALSPAMPPEPAITAAPSRGAPVGKIFSGVLLGAGVAAGVAGVLTWTSVSAERSRLAGLTDASGQFPTAGTAAHREALQLMAALDENRAAAFTLVGLGAGAVVGGALGLLLFPGGEVAVAAAPLRDGAALGLSGTW